MSEMCAATWNGIRCEGSRGHRGIHRGEPQAAKGCWTAWPDVWLNGRRYNNFRTVVTR